MHDNVVKFRQLDERRLPEANIRTWAGMLSVDELSELSSLLAEGLARLLADRASSRRGAVTGVYAALDRPGSQPRQHYERFFMTQIHLRLEDNSRPVPNVDFVAMTITLRRPKKSGLDTGSRDAVVRWLLRGLTEALRSAGLSPGAGRPCQVLAWRFGRPGRGFSVSSDGIVRDVPLPAGFDENRYAFPPQPPSPEDSMHATSMGKPEARRLPGNRIRLSWEPVQGASGYAVDWFDREQNDWSQLECLEGKEAEPGADGRVHYEDEMVGKSANTYQVRALFGDLNEPEEVVSPSVTVP